MELTDRDVRVWCRARALVESGGLRVGSQILRPRCVVTWTLGCVDGDLMVNDAIERERQLPVDRGEAVRRLERALDLHLQRLLLAEGAPDRPLEHRIDVEVGQPCHPLRLPGDDALP